MISHNIASKIQLQEFGSKAPEKFKMDLCQWEEGTIMMAGARLDTGPELLEALKFVSAQAYGNFKLEQTAV